MPLTPEEQANVDAGLTTDGRPMAEDHPHCLCGCGAHVGCFIYDKFDFDSIDAGRLRDDMLDNEIQAILDDPTG